MTGKRIRSVQDDELNQPSDRLLAAVRQITGGAIEAQEREASMENVCAFISQFERVAETELNLAFSLDGDSLEEIIQTYRVVEFELYQIQQYAGQWR